ncbi:MAG: hypothetical protein JSR37_03230 [Verrucomicrobia bacterium]|nr:hypothetical protein [Verrucomicrobiota bacterium]MBS0636985.1 hypothetical protein [Verrucomicrobiota bacterium]
MTTVAQNDPNYLNLRSLDYSMQEKSQKPIYFKISGKNQDRHVEAVHGRFAIFIAKIACFFGAKAYDLKEVSSVLQKQIKELKTNTENIELPLDKKEHERVCRSVAKSFISCIGPGGIEKRYGNREISQSDRDTISWQIKEILKRTSISPSDSDDETVDFDDLFSERSFIKAVPQEEPSQLKNPLLGLVEKNRRVFDSILDINTAYILEQKTDEKLNTVIRDILESRVEYCCSKKTELQNKGRVLLLWSGRYNREDTLAGACFQRIWGRLEKSANEGPSEEMLSVITEAKCFLLDAEVEETNNFEKKAQSARAVALIELREFLEKAAPHISRDKYQELRSGLGQYADADMQFFSASYLESITTEKIEDTTEKIEELYSWLVDELPNTTAIFDGYYKELKEQIDRLPKDVEKDIDTTDEVVPPINPVVQDEVLTAKQKGALIHTTVAYTEKLFSELLGIEVAKELTRFSTVDQKMEYLANIFLGGDHFKAGSRSAKFFSDIDQREPSETAPFLMRRQFAELTNKIIELRDILKKVTPHGQVYLKERLEQLQLFAAMLLEAKAFVYSFNHEYNPVSEQLHHKRMLVLMELCRFADIEKNSQIQRQIAGPSGFLDKDTQTFRPSRLTTITTEEIIQLKEALFNTSQNESLKSELQKSVDLLVKFEKELTVNVKFDLFNNKLEEKSLAKQLYDSMKIKLDAYFQKANKLTPNQRAEILPTVMDAEWLLASCEIENPRYKQAQNARGLIMLRFLINLTETNLEENKKAIRAQYPQLQSELMKLKSSLAGKHLERINREELQAKLKRLGEITTPLTTRGLWRHFDTLKRELKLLLSA